MKMNLGNYYAGQSVVHQLDPRLKFVFSFLFMSLVFALHSAGAFFILFAFFTVLFFLSKIPFSVLFRSLLPVFYLVFFAAVLHLLTQVPWASLLTQPISFSFVFSTNLVTYLLKLTARLIALALTSTLLLTLVTTPIEMADAMESLLKPFEKIGFPAHAFALMMSIALRFVPILASEADKLMKAQSSRGADFDTGGIFQRLKGMASVLIPLFISSFKRAEDLALAMEARCYHGGEHRTKLKQLAFTKTDFFFATAFVFVFALLFWIDIFSGTFFS